MLISASRNFNLCHFANSAILDSLDASDVYASGTGKLQANSPVICPKLTSGNPTRRMIATIGSNDLVIDEDHLLGQSCQRCNWQVGSRGSIVFGNSLSGGKNSDFKSPMSCESIPSKKDFRR